MAKRQLLSHLLVLLLLTVPAATAADSAAQRVADLTASDGTKLRITYFAAGKPGPGVLLLHHTLPDTAPTCRGI